jgi:hypothetical protein
VKRNYPTARFRQNAESVDVTTHFNQIIHEASGDYFYCWVMTMRSVPTMCLSS